jgi:hypothetical protein
VAAVRSARLQQMFHARQVTQDLTGPPDSCPPVVGVHQASIWAEGTRGAKAVAQATIGPGRDFHTRVDKHFAEGDRIVRYRFIVTRAGETRRDQRRGDVWYQHTDERVPVVAVGFQQFPPATPRRPRRTCGGTMFT